MPSPEFADRLNAARGKHAKPKNPAKREPVAVAAVASVLVMLAALFGFDLDRETAGTIASVAVIAFGIWARSRVTPVEDE